jgi:predicted nucleic acid-binding protein
MIWLLDTNIISDLWKPRPNPGAVAWPEENREDCALSESESNLRRVSLKTGE